MLSFIPKFSTLALDDAYKASVANKGFETDTTMLNSNIKDQVTSLGNDTQIGKNVTLDKINKAQDTTKLARIDKTQVSNTAKNNETIARKSNTTSAFLIVKLDGNNHYESLSWGKFVEENHLKKQKDALFINRFHDFRHR